MILNCKNNGKVKITIASLVALSFLFLPNPSLAQQRNVKSSCRLYTSAGLVNKGKCTIRTYIEGGYIIAEIYKSWDKSGEPDKLRFTNNPNCNSWQWQSDNGCNEEFWYGDEWGYVGAEEFTENGKKQFTYSLGKAYYIIYDGFLPRP